MLVSESAAAVFQSVNPASERVIAERPAMTERQLESALERAERAFQTNRRQAVAWRSERMLALAQGLRSEREALALLVTSEMGKPLAEAQAEVDKCAVSCEYFAHQAGAFLADEPTASDSPRSFVAFRPLGVILAIMPWNYPLWQVLRFAAPALMAGNAVVLKHAPNCFGTALVLERLVREAGFPEGCLAALIIGTEPIPALIADVRVRGVTLTGSDVAGSKVAEIAGREIKKAVMELGGSDFFLVLEDADLEQAAEVGVRARFQNAGQTCIAAKRFLVADSIADEYEERFVRLAAQLQVGDPLDPATRLGPAPEPAPAGQALACPGRPARVRWRAPSCDWVLLPGNGGTWSCAGDADFRRGDLWPGGRFHQIQYRGRRSAPSQSQPVWTRWQHLDQRRGPRGQAGG